MRRRRYRAGCREGRELLREQPHRQRREPGHPPHSAWKTLAYNLSDDRNQFIGGGSMKNVFVFNNTVVRTREPNIDRHVFWTFAPDSTFMTVRNNVFVLASDISVFGPL